MAYEFNHYYELQNVATGKYVNVLGNHEDGTVKNGEAVNLFNRTNNPDQRWALENYGGNGNVRIVLQRGEGWYALNYNTRNQPQPVPDSGIQFERCCSDVGKCIQCRQSDLAALRVPVQRWRQYGWQYHHYDARKCKPELFRK